MGNTNTKNEFHNNIDQSLNLINQGKYNLGLKLLERQQQKLIDALQYNLLNHKFNYFKSKLDYIQNIILDVKNSKIKTKNILVEFTYLDDFENVEWKTNQIKSNDIDNYIKRYCT